MLFPASQRTASIGGGLLQPSTIETKSLGLLVLGFVLGFCLVGFLGWVIF